MRSMPVFPHVHRQRTENPLSSLEMASIAWAPSSTSASCHEQYTLNMGPFSGCRAGSTSGRIAHVRKKSANGRIIVAAVVADGQSPFEFAVACEAFGIDRSEDVGQPWYRFRVCGVGPAPIATETGFGIVAPYGLEALRRAHTIVVPVSATSK